MKPLPPQAPDLQGRNTPLPSSQTWKPTLILHVGWMAVECTGEPLLALLVRSPGVTACQIKCLQEPSSTRGASGSSKEGLLQAIPSSYFPLGDLRHRPSKQMPPGAELYQRHIVRQQGHFVAAGVHCGACHSENHPLRGRVAAKVGSEAKVLLP